MKFKLQPETLYLCINLLDRYLSRKEIERKYLQLVGICALLIACKYEEIYPPHIKDFIYVTDKAYTSDQLLKMEIDMLDTLNFNITIPSIIRFYERWAKLAEIEEKCFYLGRYLCELSLIEYHMLKYKPSLLSLSALYLAIKIAKCDVGCKNKLMKFVKFQDSDIKICARELLCLFQSAPSFTLTCIRDKYSRKEYQEASKIKII